MNDISKDKDYQEFFACTEVAFGTGEGLLGYGICARYRRRPPGVRDAFSKALGVKNRLSWYGSDIRYRKPPSLVPNAFFHSGAPGTRQPPHSLRVHQKIGLLLVRKADSVTYRRQRGYLNSCFAVSSR